MGSILSPQPVSENKHTPVFKKTNENAQKFECTKYEENAAQNIRVQIISV
jgi:hypothetical protein